VPVGLYFGSEIHNLIPGLAPGSEITTFRPPDITATDEHIILSEHTLAAFVPVTLSHTGVVIPTFYDEWYNRIHFIPTQLELGNIINDQTRPLRLWNAYFTNKNLVTIDIPSGVGLSLTDPYGVPYPLRALELLTYTLVVDDDGSSVINTTLTWSITGEDDIVIPVTGRRIVVWPFQPNWSSPYVESLEWKTDVITSFSGDEQRIQLRSKPRRTVEYTITANAFESSMLANLLWGWQNQNFAVPVWTDKTLLTSPAVSGSTTLSLDTSNRNFFSPGLLILINSVVDYEVVEIDSVETSTITLGRPLENNWSADTMVYPVNISYIPESVSSRRLSDSVLQVFPSFNSDPIQTEPYIPSLPTSTSHAGYEVILRKPNWARPVQIDNLYEYDSVDFLTGGVSNAPSRTYPKITRRFQWVLKGKTNISQFKGLLGRLKGRYRAAYLPTWFDDFKLYATENASSVSIRVTTNEFHKMVGSDPALNTLMILMHSGDVIIRTITSTSISNDGFTILVLNASIGQDLSSSTLSRLSLVHLARLTTDRVLVNWLTDSTATVEANFTLVNQ
jgi:hypothetical protein